MIDLVSDTVTEPSPEMRKAIAEAPVGDSQRAEDPTVNELQAECSQLLGKEAALFVVSATMANQIAYKVHTRPGDEIIMDRWSHPIHYEGAGPAVLSSVMIHPLDGDRGVFGAEDVLGAIRPDDPHAPRTRLVSVEHTHNLGGGKVWPLETLEAVSEAARGNGLAVHMDGSRLMNAVVAAGIPARQYASAADSVTVCFTKGLGAPVGAVLAGEKGFMKDARRYQQSFGGAMRQAGIIAAGALYGLRHNVERLAEDHANAKLLAERLAGIEGVILDPSDVETNIVFFGIRGAAAPEFVERLKARGVRMGAYKGGRVRAVTHLGVTREDVIAAADAVGEVIGGR
ncbi:MAG: aminotransferase class I/II-fold pyridoxal phosphate-dependent enzyme [Armatimonadetes bacterium]|nr:aminotransferase class I/II-fold pyridoxal phosphate-dependent enzyme [Armatimonadota bacterium]